MLLGREDAAFAEAERGHALAPSSRFVAGARAQTMYLGGRYDEAIASAANVCASTRRTCSRYTCVVCAYLAKSIRDAAITDLERPPR